MYICLTTPSTTISNRQSAAPQKRIIAGGGKGPGHGISRRSGAGHPHKSGRRRLETLRRPETAHLHCPRQCSRTRPSSCSTKPRHRWIPENEIHVQLAIQGTGQGKDRRGYCPQAADHPQCRYNYRCAGRGAFGLQHPPGTAREKKACIHNTGIPNNSQRMEGSAHSNNMLIIPRRSEIRTDALIFQDTAQKETKAFSRSQPPAQNFRTGTHKSIAVPHPPLPVRLGFQWSTAAGSDETTDRHRR